MVKMYYTSYIGTFRIVRFLGFFGFRNVLIECNGINHIINYTFQSFLMVNCFLYYLILHGLIVRNTISLSFYFEHEVN